MPLKNEQLFLKHIRNIVCWRIYIFKFSASDFLFAKVSRKANKIKKKTKRMNSNTICGFVYLWKLKVVLHMSKLTHSDILYKWCFTLLNIAFKSYGPWRDIQKEQLYGIIKGVVNIVGTEYHTIWYEVLYISSISIVEINEFLYSNSKT